MLRLITATPPSRCRLLTAYYPTYPHIPISSIESHHIPSVVSLGFVTLDPVPLTSAVVFCLRSASVVFVFVTPLRPTGHFCPISLLFHSPPSPATGGPGDSNNTNDLTKITNSLHAGLKLYLSRLGTVPRGRLVSSIANSSSLALSTSAVGISIFHFLVPRLEVHE